MSFVLGAAIRAIFLTRRMLDIFSVCGAPVCAQNPTAKTTRGAGTTARGHLAKLKPLWLAAGIAFTPNGQSHAQELPELAVNLSMSPPQAKSGEIVVFTITIENISSITLASPGVYHGVSVSIPGSEESISLPTSGNCFLRRSTNTTITTYVPDLMGPGDSCFVEFERQILTEADIGPFISEMRPFEGPATVAFSQGPITILAQAPTITSITPPSGGRAGGQAVTISGDHFDAGGATVTFGGVAATDVETSSPDSLTATVPAGTTPGVVDVVVTTVYGGSSTPASYTYTNSPPVPADKFYTTRQGVELRVPAPGLLEGATDPDNDPWYLASVDLSGESVAYDTAGFLLWPAGDDAFFGEHAGNFTIADTHGAEATASLVIRVEPTVPEVTAVLAAQGPLAGGIQVTISGANFLGATDVSFGGVAATFSVDGPTSITATVPPGTAAGPVDVRVHKLNAAAGMNVSAALPGAFTYLEPGMLSVTDDAGLAVTGPIGGPFTPASKTWTLENTGDESIDVQIAATGTFFDVTGAVSGTSFTLAPDETRAVTATLNATAERLPIGPHAGSIAFANTTSGAGNTDRSIAVDVEQTVTSLVLAVSSPTSTVGDSLTLTATVSNASDPCGTVEFFDGNTSLGTAPIADDAATLAVPALGAGQHSFTAVYSGDANNAGSASNTVPHAVEQIGTTLSLTATPVSVTAGEAVTLSVAVTPAPPLPASVDVSGPGGFGATVALDAAGTGATTTAALPVGAHTINASYAGSDEYAPSSGTARIAVEAVATTVALTSSKNPSNSGETVTFTATVAPASAGGNLVFSIDGADQPQAAVTGDVASFTTSLLGVGDHQIVARYLGDATHAASESSPLSQKVRTLGSVVIRQETDGPDAVFGFSSPTPALNISIPTSGGRGESAAISLPAGSYALTANDMTGAGFGLAGLVCSDGDSTVDLASRTADIVLDAGEALVCTFTSANSREKTTELIEDFLNTRASLILSSQPDIQRRIDRLNGVVPSGGNPVSALMNYLPGTMEGGPLSVSTSLGVINRLAGNEKPGRFDIWFEGTFALFDMDGPNGDFSTASVGADYLVTPNLLIGAFVQMDHLSQDSTLDAATISGVGWLAGPYATARISDHLYFDVLAAAGTSSNKVSPYGTYEDRFDATRWLVSASLQGQWQRDNWTFSPRVRASYFEEATEAYSDSLGVRIPSITAGLGQIAIGPAVSYRHITQGDVVIDTGLRFEGLADILNTSTASGFDNLRARIEGTLDFALPGGMSFGLSAAYDGIGSDRNATSAKLRFSTPIN